MLLDSYIYILMKSVIGNYCAKQIRYYKKNIHQMLNKQNRQQGSSSQSRIQSHQRRERKDSITNRRNNLNNNAGSKEKNHYNFTVAVRAKPYLPTHPQNPNLKDQLISYSRPDSKTLVVEYPQGYSHSYLTSRFRKYNFDSVFIDRKNQEIYEQLIRPRLDVLKQNINLTVLTYGITGSGKTHTIFGNRELREEGIVTLCFEDAMREARSLHGQDMEFSFSFMQIYNELVHDLLQQQPHSGQNEAEDLSQPKLKSLNVLEDNKGKVNIPQLIRKEVHSMAQLKGMIEKGNMTRACSSNLVNKLSSRSHALLQLFCWNKRTRIENVVTIIDLAGSQRYNSTGGPREQEKSLNKQNRNLQKEGSNINRSLLALGNCIKGLETGESHIPFRDSKLTRILKDDLSGKAHNIMIACVSRSLAQSEETINTLNYAARATQIKVQKVDNTQANENYECAHCYRLIAWKEIEKMMPSKLKGNYQEKKAQKSAHPYEDFLIEQLRNLHQEILELVHHEKQTESLTCNPLFQSSSGEDNNTHRWIRERGVNDIFEHYSLTLLEGLRERTGSQRKDQVKPLKSHGRQGDQSRTESQEKMYETCKVKGLARMEDWYEDTVSQSALNSNGHPTLRFRNTLNLNSTKMDTFREQPEAGSHLRKQLSLKDGNWHRSANTTNATLSDLSNLCIESGRVGHRKLATRRMNPDVEGEVDCEKITNKKTIIDKIIQAKRKVKQSSDHIEGQIENEIEFIHQNCPQFQFEQDYHEGKKKTDQPIRKKRAKTFMKVASKQRDQIYVSSFMEDVSEMEQCC